MICLIAVWPDSKHRIVCHWVVENLKIVNHFTMIMSRNVNWVLFSEIVLVKNIHSVILAIGEPTIAQILEFGILCLHAICLIEIIRFSLSFILKLNNTYKKVAGGSCIVHWKQLNWGVQRKDACDIDNIKHNFFQERSWFYWCPINDFNNLVARNAYVTNGCQVPSGVLH